MSDHPFSLNDDPCFMHRFLSLWWLASSAPSPSPLISASASGHPPWRPSSSLSPLQHAWRYCRAAPRIGLWGMQDSNSIVPFPLLHWPNVNSNWVLSSTNYYNWLSSRYKIWGSRLSSWLIAVDGVAPPNASIHTITTEYLLTKTWAALDA